MRQAAIPLLLILSAPLSWAWSQEPAAADASSRIEEHLSAAVKARGQEMPRQVNRHVNLAWALAKEDLVLRRVFIEAAARLGVHAAARWACVKTLPVAARDAFLHGACGASYLELELYVDAARVLEKATKLETGNERWWNLLGWARLNLFQIDEAFVALDRAIELGPENLATLRLRAQSEIRSLRLADCETTLLRILDQEPQDPAALLLLLRVRRTRGHYEAARELGAESVRSFPQAGKFRLEYGRTLLEVGRVEEAADTLERAAKLLPGDPKPHLFLVKVYTILGQAAKAAQARETFDSLEKQGKQ